MSTRPRHFASTLMINAVAALVLFAINNLVFSKSLTPDGRPGPAWPMSGISFALVLLFGYRCAPGIAIGSFVASWVRDGAVIQTLPGVLANVVEPLLSVWMLRRVTDVSRLLVSVRGVIWFLLIAAVLSPAVSTVIHVCSWLARGDPSGSPDIMRDALLMVVSNASGVLVFGPPLPLWATVMRSGHQPIRWGEFVGLMLASLGLGWLTFAMTIHAGAFDLHPLAFGALPFCLFAVFRLGAAPAATVTLVTASFALVCTGLGYGPFASMGLRLGVFSLGVYLMLLSVTPLLVGAVLAERDHAMRQVIEREELEARLFSELDHRVRNNLASLSALIDMTARSHKDTREFARAIQARVEAMSKMHSMLSSSKWQPVELSELLVPFVPVGASNQVTLHGPRVLVASERARALAFVVHELFENARTHGALSNPAGAIEVRWSVDEPDPQGVTMLHMDWIEHAAQAPPPVTPGLGTSLIRGFVESELSGVVRLEFPARGACHRFSVRIDGC